MSKKYYRKEETESEESEVSNVENIEAYINASEMYLEALKLSDAPGVDAAYIIGMTAVYFGKAYLEFTGSDNLDSIKSSLREAINAYANVVTFCEGHGIGKQFTYTARLVITSMRTEIQTYN